MEITLIDTSIIIEPFTNYQKGKKNYKEAALALLRYQKRPFIPAISMSILGELEFIMNTKEILNKESEAKREARKEILNSFLKDCKIVGLTKDTIHLASKILNEDYSLDPLDVLHFATAIESRCNAFTFIDDKIKNSQVVNRIAREYNLKVCARNPNLLRGG